MSYGDSLRNHIYNTLRQEITDGTKPAGAVMHQEALAKRFLSSRSPIREALSRLEAEGLVLLRPRRGYIVKELSPDEIMELFEMRAALEENAVFVATSVRKSQDIETVKKLLEGMQTVSDHVPMDHQKWMLINREFHHRMYVCSGRKRLCDAISALRDQTDAYIRSVIGDQDHLGVANRDHDEIFAAFEVGNANLAARLSKEHCLSTARFMLEKS